MRLLPCPALLLATAFVAHERLPSMELSQWPALATASFGTEYIVRSEHSLSMEAASNRITTRCICKSRLVRPRLCECSHLRGQYSTKLSSSSRRFHRERSLLPATATITALCLPYQLPGRAARLPCQREQNPPFFCSSLLPFFSSSTINIHPSISSTSHFCINYHRNSTPEPLNH